MREYIGKALNAWHELDSKTKRSIVVVVAITTIIGVAALGVSAKNNIKAFRPRKAQDTIESTPLTGANLNDISIERLMAQVTNLGRKVDRLSSANHQMAQDLAARKAAPPPTPSAPQLTSDQIKALVNKEVNKKASELEAKPSKATPIIVTHKPAASTAVYHQQGDEDGSSTVVHGSAVENAPGGGNPFASHGGEEQAAATQQDQGAGKKAGAPASVGGAIRQISPVHLVSMDNSSNRAPRTYIPMGSIISGVFITGVDAGTGQNSRKNPAPALIRIKRDAVLPNGYSADVRECFTLASGYGDLSSERVYMRSEGISCVRKDGSTIEVPAEMFAVGEDGKAGVRGRLVSKQGQLLAKSLTAGMMSGFAQVFNMNAIPTMNLTSTSTTPFQRVLSPNSVQTGAVRGASNALNTLAQFYIKQAQQLFPVIEVDASRHVDFVVTKGFDMKKTDPGDIGSSDSSSSSSSAVSAADSGSKSGLAALRAISKQAGSIGSGSNAGSNQ